MMIITKRPLAFHRVQRWRQGGWTFFFGSENIRVSVFVRVACVRPQKTSALCGSGCTKTCTNHPPPGAGARYPPHAPPELSFRAGWLAGGPAGSLARLLLVGGLARSLARCGLARARMKSRLLKKHGARRYSPGIRCAGGRVVGVRAWLRSWPGRQPPGRAFLPGFLVLFPSTGI